MSKCWDYFKYANISDYNEIESIFKNNIRWFAHVDMQVLKNKILRKECIFEGGVIITFHHVVENEKIGNTNIPIGCTILEQILRSNLEKKSDYAKHLIKKFINCCREDVYFSVKKSNLRAANFYKKLQIDIIDHAYLYQSNEASNIYKVNNIINEMVD